MPANHREPLRSRSPQRPFLRVQRLGPGLLRAGGCPEAGHNPFRIRLPLTSLSSASVGALGLIVPPDVGVWRCSWRVLRNEGEGVKRTHETPKK